MSQISTFTVNDGADTPVAQVFSVNDRDGMKSTFRNAAASLVRGMKQFIHEARIGKTASAANRVLLTWILPTEGTVNGQIVVLRQSTVKLEYNWAPDATEDERQALEGIVRNTLANADIKAATIAVSTLS